MGTEERIVRAHLSLVERLTPEGVPRTRFFAAVRLLEQLTSDAPRIGGEGPFSAEAISFRHSPSFASQPNELESIRQVVAPRTVDQALEAKHHRFEVTTCFLGLSGADSPLPLYMASELIFDDAWSRRQAHFLDIFHNRMLALFYRAIAKYDYPREWLSTANDAPSARVLALAGLDVSGQTKEAVSRRELLRLAALFTLGGATGRSIENGLVQLMAPDLGGVPLKLSQFTGGWVNYDAAQTNRLGQANNEAGASFMLGTRVRHPGNRAQITIGPMSPELARNFSPGGKSYERIRDLVSVLCGEPLTFDLELLIREGEYPPFILGRRILGKDICLSGKRNSGRVVSQIHDLDGALAPRKHNPNHGS
ncbi:MAG: type VI secretion system baseplate subunit TssG [Nannocystaceae bacterium]|nr:type VI secretion system baseplate subunit TssG [Nannocystaceae bacterium]